MVKVYKFGGASVKDADAIQNVADILAAEYRKTHLICVVSAIGDTTNRLERLAFRFFEKQDKAILEAEWQSFTSFHLGIAKQLLITPNSLEQVVSGLKSLKDSLSNPSEDFNEFYDNIVGCGELLSTELIHLVLQQRQINITWKDARNVIKTSGRFRSAEVDLRKSKSLTRKDFIESLEQGYVLTQGFIGSDNKGRMTTLGREGSDYSAALFSNFLDADYLTLWKDVDGVYNADPKRYGLLHQHKRLSYQEAAEMTFYGAKVIHPKTIKPLEEKQIPLLIRSFINKDKEGTLIGGNQRNASVPSVIIKKNLHLLKITFPEFLGADELQGFSNWLQTSGSRCILLHPAAYELLALLECPFVDRRQLDQFLNLRGDIQLTTPVELQTILAVNETYKTAYYPKNAALWSTEVNGNLFTVYKSS